MLKGAHGTKVKIFQNTLTSSHGLRKKINTTTAEEKNFSMAHKIYLFMTNSCLSEWKTIMLLYMPERAHSFCPPVTTVFLTFLE